MVKRRRLNGQMLTEEEAVNRRWAEHFELLNFEDNRAARITAVAFNHGVPRMDTTNEALITKTEVPYFPGHKTRF